MSLNWVMLDETNSLSFISLPGERLIYQSPLRTALSLSTSPDYPGSRPISLFSGGGIAFLTNQRVVYIPSRRTAELESFSCPIPNLLDTHVSAPFFGPNIWTALVQPVPGGGLPSTDDPILLKLVFKDGGAFDFYALFERVKEKIMNARADGADSTNVHLDELPTYEDAGGQPAGGAVRPAVADLPVDPQPSEPPPGYEETQREIVASELERQLDRIGSQRISEEP